MSVSFTCIPVHIGLYFCHLTGCQCTAHQPEQNVLHRTWRELFFTTLLAHLAVSGVRQPLEGEVVRLRVDKVVVVELRLEDSGGRLRLQAHPVAHEEDHVLGQPWSMMR